MWCVANNYPLKGSQKHRRHWYKKMKLTAAVKMSPFTQPPQDLLKLRESEQLFTLQYLNGVKFTLEQATKAQTGE